MPEHSQGQQRSCQRFAVLRNRKFALLFGGQVTSQFGDGMYTIALMWYMYLVVHRSPHAALWMALIPIASTVPKVVVAPLSGVLVDRWHKRLTMVGSDVVRGAAVTVIAILVSLHVAQPWELIGLAFVLAVAGTCFMPAQAVLLRHIVTGEELVQANSLRNSANSVMQVVSPAVAGALLALPLGVAMVFWLDALTFAVSVLTLLLLRAKEPAVEKRPLTTASLFGDLSEGWQAVYQFPYTKVLTPFILVFNFALAAVESTLIYLYVPRTMRGTGSTIGFLNASLAVGEVVGGLALATVTARLAKEKMMTVAMVITALSVAVIGTVHSVWIAAVLFFIGGFCMIMVNITFFSRIQAEVPPQWLGRVWALLGAMFTAAIPLSNLLFGALASTVPVGLLIIVCGLIGAASGLGAFLHPLVRRAEAPPAAGIEA